ncbi:uncharacterized protein LOC110007192 [Amborella trichopoda]|uniref:uncharacterized protein LOC110007192 n=1 Tax=Amborella trichopoda TaxID=13333 RepID=UPI0009BFADD5|nr:uncharacterized protein LOC110007192 [Amborella trichopoda]|eukprot:XP_020522400.1 uncharacterized protein LOC110007192 [Amborella trichopoda]
MAKLSWVTTMAHFLGCCHHLEEIVFWLDQHNPEGWLNRDPKVPTYCIEDCLRTVVIRNFSGLEEEEAFAVIWRDVMHWRDRRKNHRGRLSLHFWDDKPPSYCIGDYLKTVVIKNFSGLEGEEAFVRLLLIFAMELKKIIVSCY